MYASCFPEKVYVQVNGNYVWPNRPRRSCGSEIKKRRTAVRVNVYMSLDFRMLTRAVTHRRLKGLFISIYSVTRNRLFSEYNANYRMRGIEQTDERHKRCELLSFLLSRKERASRTIALNSSYSKDQLISNELGERQLHISGKAFHTGASPPLPPSFSSTKDTSRFKKKQQASRLSCSLLPQPPCLFFPVVPLPRGLLAKENPRTDASFSPRDLPFSRFFPFLSRCSREQQAGKRRRLQSDANRELFRPDSLCSSTYREHCRPFSAGSACDHHEGSSREHRQ